MSRTYLLQRHTIALTVAAILITAIASAQQTQICPPGDVDGDCYVDLNDLALVAHYWLADRIICDPGYLDCDDIYDNACETALVHTDTCTTAQPLGAVRGNRFRDIGLGCASVWVVGPSSADTGSGWYVITVQDDGSTAYCPGMRFQVSLSVPSDTDYTLYLYDACPGDPVASSVTHGDANEMIKYNWPSGNRTFWIEVRYISATSPAAQCSTWQLQTSGGGFY